MFLDTSSGTGGGAPQTTTDKAADAVTHNARGQLSFSLAFNENAAVKGQNGYGQKSPKKNDYCFVSNHTALTADSVGRVLKAGSITMDGKTQKYLRVAFLSGRCDDIDAARVGKLTAAQAREARDYVVEKEQCPKLIRRDFWK